MTAADLSPDDLVVRAREFALAAQLAAYPADDTADVVDDLLQGLSHTPGSSDRTQLTPAVTALRTQLLALRADYLQLFDVGQGRSSLYETEYGRMRGMSKGNDLADISGFYQAFGFAIDDGAPEMPDHLAVELEFYTLMLLKEAALLQAGDDEGVAVVRDARQKFLLDHLGRLAAAVGARRENVEHALLGGVFRYASDLVAAECKSAGVTPAPLDYFAAVDDKSDDDSECGGGLPILGQGGKV